MNSLPPNSCPLLQTSIKNGFQSVINLTPSLKQKKDKSFVHKWNLFILHRKRLTTGNISVIKQRENCTHWIWKPQKSVENITLHMLSTCYLSGKKVSHPQSTHTVNGKDGLFASTAHKPEKMYFKIYTGTEKHTECVRVCRRLRVDLYFVCEKKTHVNQC